MHNTNIYRPLAQTMTCFSHNEETNISQKTVGRSIRQQLTRYTTWKEGACKTLRGRKYLRRKANRKIHPAQDITIKSHDTYKQCEHVNGLCLAGWLNVQAIIMCCFPSIPTWPYSSATGRNTSWGKSSAGAHWHLVEHNCLKWLHDKYHTQRDNWLGFRFKG